MLGDLLWAIDAALVPSPAIAKDGCTFCSHRRPLRGREHRGHAFVEAHCPVARIRPISIAVVHPFAYFFVIEGSARLGYHWRYRLQVVANFGRPARYYDTVCPVRPQR